MPCMMECRDPTLAAEEIKQQTQAPWNTLSSACMAAAVSGSLKHSFLLRFSENSDLRTRNLREVSGMFHSFLQLDFFGALVPSIWYLL